MTDPDRKACSLCGKTKPLGAYYRLHTRGSWMARCKVCHGLRKAEYVRTDAHRLAKDAYLSRPGVREKLREQVATHARKPAAVARRRERARTPLGRVLHCRRQATFRLRHGVSPERAKALARLIAAYDREIARLRLGLAGDAA